MNEEELVKGDFIFFRAVHDKRTLKTFFSLTDWCSKLIYCKFPPSAALLLLCSEFQKQTQFTDSHMYAQPHLTHTHTLVQLQLTSSSQRVPENDSAAAAASSRSLKHTDDEMNKSHTLSLQKQLSGKRVEPVHRGGGCVRVCVRPPGGARPDWQEVIDP